MTRLQSHILDVNMKKKEKELDEALEERKKRLEGIKGVLGTWTSYKGLGPKPERVSRLISVETRDDIEEGVLSRLIQTFGIHERDLTVSMWHWPAGSRSEVQYHDFWMGVYVAWGRCTMDRDITEDGTCHREEMHVGDSTKILPGEKYRMSFSRDSLLVKLTIPSVSHDTDDDNQVDS